MGRRPAAIFAADVVGYSRLMSADETGTLERLKTLRKALIQPKITAREGRIVKLMGDGLLAEFPSVVEAVQCAVDIQHAIAAHEADAPEDRRIRLRIGVNLGDIIVEGSDIYGDGVNVAARLEGLAEPGGVCISGPAFDTVEGKLDLAFEDIGPRQVKNLARPVRAYRLAAAAAHMGELDELRECLLVADEPPVEVDLPDKPSIAVLPFTNLSDDIEQEYFADGIADDIITALARSRWFLVIARNSSFSFKGEATKIDQIARALGVRYVLEGSMRKSAQRLRISTRLVDAIAGSHLWAERYDRELTDIFAVQDEIVERVAGAIEPELLMREGLRATARDAGDLSVWDLVRQGTWQFHQFSRPTHMRAREIFREAVQLDPHFPEAQNWLGRVNESIVAYGWSNDVAADLREAVQSCLKGVQLDEKDPYGHYALSMSYLFSGDLNQALQAADRALELCPTFALAHLGVGLVRLYSGNAAEAVESLERGLRLNPFDRQNFLWFRTLSLAYYFTGDPTRALQAGIRAVQVRPAWRPAVEAMTICHVALGNMEDARRAAARLTQLEKPESDVLEQFRLHNPDWAEDIAKALKTAKVSPN